MFFSSRLECWLREKLHGSECSRRGAGVLALLRLTSGLGNASGGWLAGGGKPWPWGHDGKGWEWGYDCQVMVVQGMAFGGRCWRGVDCSQCPGNWQYCPHWSHSSLHSLRRVVASPACSPSTSNLLVAYPTPDYSTRRGIRWNQWKTTSWTSSSLPSALTFKLIIDANLSQSTHNDSPSSPSPNNSSHPFLSF